MMEESLEQIGQTGKDAAPSSPEDSYYHLKAVNYQAWYNSRQVVDETYQTLHAHHEVVQTLYELLEDAIWTGQERKTIWDEYREAIKQHHQLVLIYTDAMEQHRQQLRDFFPPQAQNVQS